MTRYAADTDVPVDRTRSEIERTLQRYGATSFAIGWDEATSSAVIGFKLNDRFVRLRFALPSINAPAITLDRNRRRKTKAQIEAAFAQAERTRWRAVLLVIKAKLESVESEIETFEQAFLPHILLPDGSTVGDYALPAIAESYATGAMPQLLPGLGARALPAGGYEA